MRAAKSAPEGLDAYLNAMATHVCFDPGSILDPGCGSALGFADWIAQRVR